MANSSLPGFFHSYPAMCCVPARTPGPLGRNDHGDPSITSRLGDTPGPLGWNDYADQSLLSLEFARGLPIGSPQYWRFGGVAPALCSVPRQPLDEVLVFPDTRYRYRRTTLSLDSCLATLPADLRADFKTEIETIIREMHALGFALGLKNNPRTNLQSGYRTFQDQCMQTATRAGPGESFHNYLCAVDLGFLEWVDEEGKSHDDYWLGEMEKTADYEGFAARLWEKRNGFSSRVYPLDFERIHLQGVPANRSGPALLVNCLNQAATDAGDAQWIYRRAARAYECTLGNTGNRWTAIGSARQLWDGLATDCTDQQRETIRTHMRAAETIARTINLE